MKAYHDSALPKMASEAATRILVQPVRREDPISSGMMERVLLTCASSRTYFFRL